jgi:hypothetical protein
VDECEVEHGVGAAPDGEHGERPAQVAQPAQHALRRDAEQHPGHAEAGDPQERHAAPAHLVLDPDQVEEHRPGELHDSNDGEADDEAGPNRLRRQPLHPGSVAGADPTGDEGRGGVGEHVAQPDQGGQHGRRRAQRRQLGGAEPTHDRGVDQDEERLGGERAERGDGQPHDLAVELAGPHVGQSSDRSRSRSASSSPSAATASLTTRHASPAG